MTEYNNFKDMVIEDGLVKNIKMSGARKARTLNNQDASLNFCVDLNGMPVADLMKYFWDGFKIKSAAKLRKMTVAEAEAMSGVCVHWSEMVGAQDQQALAKEVSNLKIQQIKNVELSARAFKTAGMDRSQVKGIISDMGITAVDVETVLNAVFN